MAAGIKKSKGANSKKPGEPTTSKKSKPGPKKDFPSAAFPVIGIGSSAGGLEAIQVFFSAMPDDDPEMAFVVISHLDPSHKSILAELIQKHSRMEVHQIEDGLDVRPNHVYVIPPNRELEISGGTFVLTQASSQNEQRAPINLFFRSLAQERGELAAGIVFSGMGSDGAIGLQAIKTEMGLTLVQDPYEAKYDGMPRSAINTGGIDFVLPVNEMPQYLIDYFQRIPGKENFQADQLDSSTLSKIHMVLRNKSGHDFSHYKESTVRRRIQRRLTVHGFDNPADYLRYLQRHPSETKALVKELLIGVTQFFRDPPAFDSLKETVLPKLLTGKTHGWTIRAWVAGCATGEEAYSLAIILREYIDEHELDLDFQIFATDLDNKAIENARTGIYPADIALDMSSRRLKRFFQQENAHYRVQAQIREKIVFAPQSLIKDPPFTRLDLLLCRNLLIYLDAEIQKKLVSLFHYSLNPGGILFLGHSETVAHFENHFDVLDPQWKIYQRKKDFNDSSMHWDLHLNLPQYDEKQAPNVKPTHITNLAERALLDHFTPPAIIIDRQGEIRYIHGRIHKFLEHAQGAVRSYNAFEMAREGLKIHLLTTIRQMRPDAETNRTIIQIGQDGETIEARVTVSPLREEAGRGLYVVMFEEIPPVKTPPPNHNPKTGGKEDESLELQDLRSKLLVCEEKLRTTVEELESTNEELRSSNEEYQSTNEELQSANEELNSSKEELQSLNEELETVNAELQGKVQQVERAYKEMSKMLDSLNMPVIFLDKNLCIKRFSSHAHIIMELINSDVGRPVKQLHSKIRNVDLEKEARKVLASQSPVEKEVETKIGQWFLMRILPYPDRDHYTNGVVVSFVDINALKEISSLMSQMEREWRLAQGIVDTVREPLVVLDQDMMVLSASQVFYKKFRVNPEETEGRSLFDLGDGQWGIPELRQLLKEVLSEKKVFNDYDVVHDFSTIGRRKMRLNARAIQEPDTAQNRILLAIEDVTEKERGQ